MARVDHDGLALASQWSVSPYNCAQRVAYLQRAIARNSWILNRHPRLLLARLRIYSQGELDSDFSSSRVLP
jgi:hypothetical protein